MAFTFEANNSLEKTSNLDDENTNDNRIFYFILTLFLVSEYPNDLDKIECMIAEFKQNNLFNKLFKKKLMEDQTNIKEILQPYIDEANLKCMLSQFFHSPLVICVIVGILLLIVGLIVYNLCLKKPIDI